MQYNKGCQSRDNGRLAVVLCLIDGCMDNDWCVDFLTKALPFVSLKYDVTR